MIMNIRGGYVNYQSLRLEFGFILARVHRLNHVRKNIVGTSRMVQHLLSIVITNIMLYRSVP